MIFVTVGLEKFPFDRLFYFIDDSIREGAINDEVISQIGSSRYRPKSFNYYKFLPFQEMVNFIQKAEIVISHGGVGSVLLCLNSGKIPIVFPRFKKYGEHLDNHQLEFSEKMKNQQKVITAYNKQQLTDKIKHHSELVRKLQDANIKSSKNDLIFFLKKSL